MDMASTIATQPRIMAFRGAGHANPAALYLARLSPSSRATMRWALRAIARALGGPEDPLLVDWARVGYGDVVAVRAALGEGYKPATANCMLSALRGTLREAWRLGQLDADAYHRAIDVPAVRGSGLPAGCALQEAELAALLQACLADAGPARARDAAIVALLASSGLRRAELAALELADYDAGSGALTVREGKGRKGRRTYAAPAGPYLARWLAVRGERPGPLFVPVRRGGALLWRHLSGHAIWRIVRRRAGQAGLRAFTPHDFRRTWVSNLLDAGADLASAQALAGHANPATTAGYDRRAERARERAAALLQLPRLEDIRHADGEPGEHPDDGDPRNPDQAAP